MCFAILGNRGFTKVAAEADIEGQFGSGGAAGGGPGVCLRCRAPQEALYRDWSNGLAPGPQYATRAAEAEGHSRQKGGRPPQGKDGNYEAALSCFGNVLMRGISGGSSRISACYGELFAKLCN